MKVLLLKISRQTKDLFKYIRSRKSAWEAVGPLADKGMKGEFKEAKGDSRKAKRIL